MFSKNEVQDWVSKITDPISEFLYNISPITDLIPLNQDQAKSAARWVATVYTGYMVNSGFLTAGIAGFIISVIPGVISLLWSLNFHSGETKSELKKTVAIIESNS